MQGFDSSKNSNAPNFIAMDWGTTALRAWFWRNGKIVDQRTSMDASIAAKHPLGFGTKALWTQAAQQGVSHNAVFEHAARLLVDDWLTTLRNASLGEQVVICGMAGSRQGWREAPYVPAPASLGDLASACLQVLPGWYIAPGVSSATPADVMRGEETQLLGAALAMNFRGKCLLVMPGTHSKHVWFDADQQVIESFRTYFTGEMFALLSEHSLLAASLVSKDFDQNIFSSAVRIGARQSPTDGALLNEVFAIRARQLLDLVPAAMSSCWLSGLLIGHELAEISKVVKTSDLHDPLCLIGASSLTEKYALALRSLVATEQPRKILFAPEHSSAIGLNELARVLFKH